MQPAQRYLSIPEAAKMLGVSRVTLFRYVKQGKIPAVRVGKGYLVERAHVPARTQRREGTPRLAPSRQRLAAFCRKHHIKRLALFGSVLRGDFRPDSDVDVLVEFEPGHTPGLTFFAMQDELSRLFGRPVNLQTPRFLSRHFRDAVVAEAQAQYGQPR